MKLTHLNSACVVIESNGFKILCDPFLNTESGPFYNAWGSYPPLDVDLVFFEDIDYIYISHIHPDHFHVESLKILKKLWDKINKKVKVLVFKFKEKFLLRNIQRLGYECIEVGHGEFFNFNSKLSISIYSADGCDTEVCGKWFGCHPQGHMEWIDTLSVITDGNYTICNVNDCPYVLSIKTLELVKKQHKKIDLLLVGYSGASSFPQCFSYAHDVKMRKKDAKIHQFLMQGQAFINNLQPRYYMPFAGTYVLQGYNSFYNSYIALPSLEEAIDNYSQCEGQGFLLNSLSSFDLKTEQVSSDYKKINNKDKNTYVDFILSKKKYTYENDEYLELSLLKNLVSDAYNIFENKRKQLGYESNTNIYLGLDTSIIESIAKISTNGNGVQFIDGNSRFKEPYIYMDMDGRLLKQVLLGPRFAHWNNADIGSHIWYKRKPDVYEKGLHYCLNYFHCL